MDEITAKISNHFSQYHAKQFGKGHVLLFPNDTVDYIYYVIEGTVKQYSISKKGDEVILNIFKPGAFFPMANVINDIPAKYMMEVETDAKIKLVPKDDALRFIKDNPDAMYDLLSRVYKGTEGLLGRLEHLMVSGAGNRFIYELLTEAKRFGEKAANGEVTVSINENSIGQRAGLSRETVNREIRKLKGKGLISIKRNSITIQSMDKLEELLD